MVKKTQERKTTSLKININLWKKVKKLCIDRDLDISDWLEYLIKKEFKRVNLSRQEEILESLKYFESIGDEENTEMYLEKARRHLIELTKEDQKIIDKYSEVLLEEK